MENTKVCTEVGGQTQPPCLQLCITSCIIIDVSMLTSDKTFKTLSLEVNLLDNIASIKDKINQAWDIPCINQRLIFLENNLEDNCKLVDYNIQDKSTLHLILNEVPWGTVLTAQQEKHFSDYYTKFAMFVVALLIIVYKSSSSVPRCITYIIVVAATIADIVFPTVKRAKWASALVYLSSCIPVSIAYVLLVSLNKYYGFAIFFVLPIAGAALQEIYGRTNNGEADRDLNSADDVEGQHIDIVFDLASNIVISCGAFACIFVPDMAGPVKAPGFFLFFTVFIGLYLMAITTVRTGALTRHVKYLAILLKLLRWATVFVTMIHVDSSKGNIQG